MANKHDRRTRKEDTKQASSIIAVCSIIGLTVCFVAAIYQKADIPLFLYAIFGGGILGTENILKVIRSVFRIDR